MSMDGPDSLRLSNTPTTTQAVRCFSGAPLFMLNSSPISLFSMSVQKKTQFAGRAIIGAGMGGGGDAARPRRACQRGGVRLSRLLAAVFPAGVADDRAVCRRAAALVAHVARQRDGDLAQRRPVAHAMAEIGRAHV